jgi:ankyrin repeat protein
MKKSIIYLSIALISFTSFSFATTTATISNTNIVVEETTPLCLAISKGETDLVKKFVEYGIDVNQESNGMTPLMMAARYNKVEIIKLLLSRGADLKTRDENGFTALRYAQLSNAKEAADLLLK